MSNPFPASAPIYFSLTPDLQELLIHLTNPPTSPSSSTSRPRLLPFDLHRQLIACMNNTSPAPSLAPSPTSSASGDSSLGKAERDASEVDEGVFPEGFPKSEGDRKGSGSSKQEEHRDEDKGGDQEAKQKPLPPAPPSSIPYPLLRQIGLFCTSPEGRKILRSCSIDPSSYHPNSLMPLTRPLLPPSLRAPPPSSNPLQSPSPFLPLTHHSNLNTDTKLAASQKSGSGGSIMGLGKEAGAVANVLFSAGGVAGGVWWVGRKSTHWSLETTTLLTFLAFFALIAVESTLYVIYFKRMDRKRQLDADVKAKWETGGLTIPDGKNVIAVVREDADALGLPAGEGEEKVIGVERDRELLKSRGKDEEDAGQVRKRVIGSAIDEGDVGAL